LVTLGTCQYYNGDDLAATLTLQRVHRLDPNHLKGMDILAALYAKERKASSRSSVARQCGLIRPFYAVLGDFCHFGRFFAILADFFAVLGECLLWAISF
jgi:hypothetical protein